jgi:hypothetical protein
MARRSRSTTTSEDYFRAPADVADVKLRTKANRQRYAAREEQRSLLATPDMAEPYAALGDQPIGLRGMAAVFDRESADLGGFREVSSS